MVFLDGQLQALGFKLQDGLRWPQAYRFKLAAENVPLSGLPQG
ncbi:hypothetical protein AK973_5188 [Pseudomonas brassicacearum]|nr:hypothetical protein AK973_5188 [Pseudomonas brassicacearum]